MSSSRSFFVTFLFFLLGSLQAGVVSADTHIGIGKNHHGIVRHEASSAANGSFEALERRAFENARFTLYAPGLNACGSVDQASDYVSPAALYDAYDIFFN